MVHGNPTWSFYWRNLIQGLENRHRVVAVDHLGCGLSDKPADFDYCLQSHIDNLVALIDQLDLRSITLMAHDWGGAIGLGALMRRRERFSRIVLFNTGAFRPHFIPFRIRVCRWPLLGTLAVRGFNLFARAAVYMATEQPGGLPVPVAEGLLFPYDNWENRVAIDRFVKDIPLGPGHRTWQVLSAIEEQLPELADWPILLIWGLKDWCFRPDCLHKFQQFWPTAEVQEFPQAGHYVVEDASEQVKQRVGQFLDEHSLG
jgi:pimeloyl-ACP methyl ester carboxylesterase